MSQTQTHYLSRSHIFGAALFARNAHKFELDFAAGEAPTKSSFLTHRSFAVGAITLAVCYLESSINEVFDCASHAPLSNLPEHKHIMTTFGALPGDLWKEFSAVWQLEEFQKGMKILRKYEVALNLAGVEGFHPGQEPIQSAKSLIDLRNALVHYKPEAVEMNLPAPRQRLEHKLRALNFENPLLAAVSGHSPLYFPEVCLCHGAAKWAVRSAVQFHDAFCAKIGLYARRDPDELLMTEWNEASSN